MRKPAKNPIDRVGSFFMNFQRMAVIARSRDFDTFDSRGSRPSGPLRRSMGKIHDRVGPCDSNASQEGPSTRWKVVVMNSEEVLYNKFANLLAHREKFTRNVSARRTKGYFKYRRETIRRQFWQARRNLLRFE